MAKAKTTANKKAAKPVAKKKQAKTVSTEQRIREAQNKGKLLIGTKTTLKCIKGGSVLSVFYTTNIPENVLKDLNYYARISDIELNKFNGDSAKLGDLCGKPFKILLAAIKK